MIWVLSWLVRIWFNSYQWNYAQANSITICRIFLILSSSWTVALIKRCNILKHDDLTPDRERTSMPFVQLKQPTTIFIQPQCHYYSFGIFARLCSLSAPMVKWNIELHKYSYQIWHCSMGLLLDTQNCGLRMRRECRERFPWNRLQRKPLVSDHNMHHGTCVMHVPWCRSGSLTCGGGENVPGIPGACATRNVTYLARDPLHGTAIAQ